MIVKHTCKTLALAMLVIRRNVVGTTRTVFATLALVGIVSTGLVAVGSAPASAHGGASGVVAVHTGSWGYREVVYGRATTHRIATSSVWELGSLLTGATATGVAAASGGAYAAGVAAATLSMASSRSPLVANRSPHLA